MKRRLAFLLSLVMIFSLVACGNNSANDGKTDNGGTTENGATTQKAEEGSIPGVKKTLVIGTAQDINQLDPQMQNDQINNICLQLSHQIMATLTNDTAEWVPQLATSWEWTDDTHLVLHLQEGVTFNTGEPMTADDVVFTYEKAMDPNSYVSGLLGLVEGVRAIDDLTVEITASTYSNELFNTFCGMPMSILSKAAYESGMKDPHLVGTGPYKLKEWVPGQYVTYERVENYWNAENEEIMADEIIFKPLLEASQRVIALQNGEIDVCIDPPITELKFLESDDNITVHTQAGTRLFYMGFNCAKEPFDNETLRQAVSCAIDKDMIIEVVLGGLGKRQTSVLNRGVWSFQDNDVMDPVGYTYDLDRAKELMAEAGYGSGGLTVELYAANTAPYSTIAPIIQANLAEIGITVNIVSLDEATLKADCQAGKHQLFLWRWNVVDRLDETYRELFYTGYGTNYHQLSDSYVDEMTDKILTEKDTDTRYEQSVELQKYMAKIVPQIPLYVPDLVIAYNKNLKGEYLYGGGNHYWSNAYISLES